MLSSPLIRGQAAMPMYLSVAPIGARAGASDVSFFGSYGFVLSCKLMSSLGVLA